jgi:hypothetical protein
MTPGSEIRSKQHRGTQDVPKALSLGSGRLSGLLIADALARPTAAAVMPPPAERSSAATTQLLRTDTPLLRSDAQM